MHWTCPLAAACRHSQVRAQPEGKGGQGWCVCIWGPAGGASGHGLPSLCPPPASSGFCLCKQANNAAPSAAACPIIISLLHHAGCGYLAPDTYNSEDLDKIKGRVDAYITYSATDNPMTIAFRCVQRWRWWWWRF